MRRGMGLFLIAVGSLIIIGCVGFTIAIFVVPQQREPFVFVIIAGAFLLIGGAMLWFGIRQLKQTSPSKYVGPDGIAGADRFRFDRDDERDHDGTSYTVHYQTPVSGKNGRPSKLTVKLETESSVPCDVRFRLQTRFDRTALSTGLARELLTGDEYFDERVYIRSRSDEYYAAYLDDGIKRAAILALLELGYTEICVNDYEIIAMWDAFDPAKNGSEPILETTVVAIRALGQNLPESDRAPFMHVTEHNAWDYILWAFVTVPAISMISLGIYTPLRFWDVLKYSLALYVILYAVFGFIAAMVLRGRSTSHDRWKRIMLTGIITLFLVSIGLITTINGYMDNAPRDKRMELIIDKYFKTNKGNKTYYVTINDWMNPGSTIDFKVNHADYDRVNMHRSMMELEIGAGTLNLPWVAQERFRP